MAGRVKLIALLAVTASLALPGAVQAATITPDIFVDEFDLAPDGDCSLREAVQSLNGNSDFGGCSATGYGTNDTVVLSATTTYSLSLGGNNEDANATGDLDVLNEDLTLQGPVSGLAAIQPISPDDRVLDVPVGGPDLTLNSISISGGNVLAGSPTNLLGGGIRFNASSSQLLLDNTDVNGNVADAGTVDGFGGGIYVGGTAPSLTVQNGSSINGNTAGRLTNRGGAGGGIRVEGSNLTVSISGSQLNGNRVGGNGGSSGGRGGGLSVGSTTNAGVTLTATDVNGNEAGLGNDTNQSNFGGGVAVEAVTASTVNVTGGTINGNSAGGGGLGAGGSGGGLYVDANGLATTTVTNPQISGNSAAGNGSNGLGIGGGIYTDSDLSLTGGTITSNMSGVGTGATGVGGGAAVDAPAGSESLTVQGTQVSQNQAGLSVGQGGGLYQVSQGNLDVDGATITGNTASGNSGGGIYRTTGGTSVSNTIDDTTIAGNTAAYGGGIDLGVAGGTLIITGSTFSSNHAVRVTGSPTGGGAIRATSDLTLVNSTLTGNDTAADDSVADTGGGGIRTDNANADLTLDHVTINQNTASNGSGGNLYLEGAAASGKGQVRASIVADGSASAAGTENCFQENLGVINSNGFNVEGTSPTQCNFVAGTDLATAGDLGLGTLGSFGGSTQTVPLLPSSPAIDRVTAGCPPPATDQRGTLRAQGPACDSGAFELEYRTLTVSTAGSGTVTGLGIACPGDCAESRPQGTQISLTPAANTGSTFTGWSGACSGTGPCNVTLDTDKAATATFTANPVTPPASQPQAKKKKCKKKKKKAASVARKCKRKKKPKR